MRGVPGRSARRVRARAPGPQLPGAARQHRPQPRHPLPGPAGTAACRARRVTARPVRPAADRGDECHHPRGAGTRGRPPRRPVHPAGRPRLVRRLAAAHRRSARRLVVPGAAARPVRGRGVARGGTPPGARHAAGPRHPARAPAHLRPPLERPAGPHRHRRAARGGCLRPRSVRSAGHPGAGGRRRPGVQDAARRGRPRLPARGADHRPACRGRTGRRGQDPGGGRQLRAAQRPVRARPGHRDARTAQPAVAVRARPGGRQHPWRAGAFRLSAGGRRLRGTAGPASVAATAAAGGTRRTAGSGRRADRLATGAPDPGCLARTPRPPAGSALPPARARRTRRGGRVLRARLRRPRRGAVAARALSRHRGPDAPRAAHGRAAVAQRGPTGT